MKSSKKSGVLAKRIKKHIPFYIMFLPVFIFYALFSYYPMRFVDIAFYEYGIFGKGKFIGLENFRTLFSSARFFLVMKNTLTISLTRLVLNMFIAIIFALLLNEVSSKKFKKTVQTVVYLPHFLSWVIVGSLFVMILSPTSGISAPIYEFFGLKPDNPLYNSALWRPIFYFIGTWKETGWGTIVYLAAITTVDPTLYEAASVDGAGRLKQTYYITLPYLIPTVLTVLILNLSKILDIFQPIFVMQNSLVYDVSDVLGTYIYRVGLENRNYSYSTAIGLFNSLVSMVLIVIANFASKKVRGRGII